MIQKIERWTRGIMHIRFVQMIDMLKEGENWGRT